MSAERPQGESQPQDPSEREITKLFEDIDYLLQASTPEVILERLFMLPIVSYALDAYMQALPQSDVPAEDVARLREEWLERALTNWQTSPDYGDDREWPQTIRFTDDIAITRYKLNNLPEGQERLISDRLIWFMVIARDDYESENINVLPPEIIQAAFDAYFYDPSYPSGIIYPRMHLITETVVRASVHPFYDDPAHWQDGLPLPVKAALDVLR